jgi:phenylalanyl-tRNA synthetase beta subunit
LLYKKSTKSWEQDTLLEAKGIVQTLLTSLGLHQEVSYQQTSFSYFHPKKQGKIMYQGQQIGKI